MRDPTDRWTLTALGDGRTRLTMCMDATLTGVMGWLMGWVMPLGVGRLLRHNLEELKHFIETGTPHPRKVKALPAPRTARP